LAAVAAVCAGSAGCGRPGWGAVAWAHHREQTGWADASPPCPSIRI
jgi:hypothetical protein